MEERLKGKFTQKVVEDLTKGNLKTVKVERKTQTNNELLVGRYP